MTKNRRSVLRGPPQSLSPLSRKMASVEASVQGSYSFAISPHPIQKNIISSATAAGLVSSVSLALSTSSGRPLLLAGCPPSYHRFSDLRTTTSTADPPTNPTLPVMTADIPYYGQSSSTTWPNYKLPIHSYPAPPPPPTCTDCTTCTTTNELTEQCTDQCVVIACDDPEHGAMICDVADHSHCDLDCDTATNCTDCNGFDEFLQCCTDYHGYFAESRAQSALPETPSSWDHAIDKVLCECGHLDHTLPTNHTHHSPLVGNNSVSPDETMTFSSTASNSPPFITPASSQLHSPQVSLRNPHSTPAFPPLDPRSSSSSMLTCMWANCNATFASLSDLVGHVNLEHLRPPSTPPQLTIPNLLLQQRQIEHTRITCLWRDCNLSSSPGSTTSDEQVDAMRAMLASHLLQDHLGLSNHPHQSPPSIEPSPQNSHFDYFHEPGLEKYSQPPPPPPVQLQPQADTHSNPLNSAPHLSSTSSNTSSGSDQVAPLPIVSAQQSQHQCSGTRHECRWQNCGQAFNTCDELTMHITAAHIGSGKAQYECFWEGCNRHGDHGFTSKQKICRHVQSHTGHRPFQCSICQQNFSEAATLQQHMRRHTQEKPYLCDYPGCGKSFAITGALTIHKRTHNGHKPFKCSYCDRAFAESSNLSKHLRTHTGARPYTCVEPGCNKSFARPDQLTRHMGVHRKKNPAIPEGG
ncbi:hypothetical protein BDQ12DRAFT_629145 [Crucibulum laeve]|uniref:C2H2-type domain-containing protein n=1 Tax=Crucibulum laeve TaxID=68775 RepID=A0A5C3MFP1_9AGAR|nr:hypothetical protein BDQ12DRAFT_629145 [Crucibulum laeve]